MINIESVAENLEKIICNIAISTNKDGEPVANNKKEFIIGNFLIKKSQGMYYVSNRTTSKVLYSELYLLDSAFSIVRSVRKKNIKEVNTILKLEEKYAKHYLDMLVYYYSYKHAKNTKDKFKMNVMEDRFHYSKQFVTAYKRKLNFLNRRNEKNDKYYKGL